VSIVSGSPEHKDDRTDYLTFLQRKLRRDMEDGITRKQEDKVGGEDSDFDFS